MKSKVLVLLSTLVMALALMAQSGPQTTPSTDPGKAKACACCNHDLADGKMTCCGKDSKCSAKEGKAGCCQGKDGEGCPMMSKGTDGKATGCAGGKCPMMSKKSGKGCCGGTMCARPQSGA
jgi:hypothetical protein